VAACKLGERLGIPVLCIADGTDVNEWTKRYPSWRYARDILNDKASAIIYVSEALRQAGAANGLKPRSEAVIHNAVDVQVFKPSLDSRADGAFSILAVGRMIPVKGQQVLLQAFAEFARRLERPARLTLVGDGPLRQALTEQAAGLGIASMVRFAGIIVPDHMPACYLAADLLCLPSFSEGLPCVAVEAMACGKPVVASNVGGVSELVDDRSGILVPPGDPKALCEALLQAAGRSWDAGVIRHIIVDGFSWTQWTEKLFHVLHSVTATRTVESRRDKRERVWPAWR
jgi:glycosyltransferase involved in cell wall biosynthesis